MRKIALEKSNLGKIFTKWLLLDLERENAIVLPYGRVDRCFCMECINRYGFKGLTLLEGMHLYQG